MEHFLTALKVQREAKGLSGVELGAAAATQSHMSEGIWSTLRLAISLLGRDVKALQEAVQSRNLDFLMKQFAVD